MKHFFLIASIMMTSAQASELLSVTQARVLKVESAKMLMPATFDLMKMIEVTVIHRNACIAGEPSNLSYVVLPAEASTDIILSSTSKYYDCPVVNEPVTTKYLINVEYEPNYRVNGVDVSM